LRLNTIRFCFTKVQKEVQTDVGIALKGKLLTLHHHEKSFCSTIFNCFYKHNTVL